MGKFWNQKGQSLLLFALFIGALMVALIGSIMMSLYDVDRSISDLKIRLESYQVTLQFSQVIQQAFKVAEPGAGCATPAGLTLVATGIRPLCLPTANVCSSNGKYCIEKNPNYNISKLEGSFQEPTEVVKMEHPSKISFSLLPEATAQTMNKSWLPALGAVPNVTIGPVTCDASTAAACTICEPVANATAYCYRVRICTNGSSTCPNSANYFSAVIAINHRKN